MKISDEEKDKVKADTIAELINYIKQYTIAMKKSDIPIKYQSIRMDVIVELVHFLLNFDENVQALKDYYRHRNNKNRE